MYLLDKMSTKSNMMNEQQKNGINSGHDFLTLLDGKIASNLKEGKQLSEMIASGMFLQLVDEKPSAGSKTPDESDKDKLNDISQQIISLKSIKRSVLEFLEKLSQSDVLDENQLEMSRILILYSSLDYKFSDFVGWISRILKEIENIRSDLFHLIYSTKECHRNALYWFNEMDKQLRTRVRALTWRTPRSNKYKQGYLVTEKAVLRPQTPEEFEKASKETEKYNTTIGKIESDVGDKLQRLQCMIDDFNQFIQRFSEISRQFKSFTENVSFFDFMMRLFQGQICEDTFREVSTNFETFCSSLQTKMDETFQCMEELEKFKCEKNEENVSRQQDTKDFDARRQANLDEWERKDIEEQNARLERERRKRELEKQNTSSSEEWDSE